MLTEKALRRRWSFGIIYSETLFYVTNLQVEPISVGEALWVIETHGRTRAVPGTGNGERDGPQASTEQRLVGGRAAGKGLRVCTGWEATSGG